MPPTSVPISSVSSVTPALDARPQRVREELRWQWKRFLSHPRRPLEYPLPFQQPPARDHPYVSLVQLGLARGYAMSGDSAKANIDYSDFFTEWKDADPDIPILKEAKAEYAKLQLREGESPSLVVCLARTSESFRRRVEVVVSSVAALHFNVLLGGVAGGCWWRLTAVGVNALDAGYPAEDALSGMTGGGHEQPRNRIRIGRIDPSYGFAGDFTPIVVFPGRTSIVSADDRSLLIVKISFRSLQGPTVLAVRSLLTGVNLRSRSVILQDNFFAGRRFNLVGYIGAWNPLSICECNNSGQNGSLQTFCDHGENSNTKGMTKWFPTASLPP
jgi:hypothetical protein